MEWRDAVGYPDYEVSDRGNVREKETKNEVHPKHISVAWYFEIRNVEGKVRPRPARLLVRAAFPELNWEYPTTVKTIETI
jgi:hypothetical protein